MAEGFGAPEQAPAGTELVAPRAGEGAGGRKPYVRWSEELAQAIIARVAAGESLSAVTDAPDMPTRTAVRHWTRTQEGFGEALMVAMREARLARRVAERQARRAWKARRRREGQPSRYTPEIGEEICTRIANGESLIAICRDAHMPWPATVYRWLGEHEDFEDMYVDARRMQGDYLFDEAREVALAARVGEVFVSRLRFDVIRWQTARLAPVKYCERLVVQANRHEAEPPPARRVFQVVRFQRGPDGRVLAVPPRDERDERAWIESTGRPYDGPR